MHLVKNRPSFLKEVKHLFCDKAALFLTCSVSFLQMNPCKSITSKSILSQDHDYQFPPMWILQACFPESTPLGIRNCHTLKGVLLHVSSLNHFSLDSLDVFYPRFFCSPATAINSWKLGTSGHSILILEKHSSWIAALEELWKVPRHPM